MISEVAIRAALSEHLNDLVLSPPVPIRGENIDYPAGSGYLEVEFLPEAPVRFGIGEEHQYSGIFQITYVSGVGASAMPPHRVAEAVRNHFPSTLHLNIDGAVIRIPSAPAIAQGYPDGASWRVPVSVSYEAWG